MSLLIAHRGIYRGKNQHLKWQDKGRKGEMHKENKIILSFLLKSRLNLKHKNYF